MTTDRERNYKVIDSSELFNRQYQQLRERDEQAAEIVRQIRMVDAAERLMCDANPNFRPLVKMGDELMDVSKPRSWLVWLFEKQRKAVA